MHNAIDLRACLFYRMDNFLFYFWGRKAKEYRSSLLLQPVLKTLFPHSLSQGSSFTYCPSNSRIWNVLSPMVLVSSSRWGRHGLPFLMQLTFSCNTYCITASSCWHPDGVSVSTSNRELWMGVGRRKLEGKWGVRAHGGRCPSEIVRRKD